MGCVSTIAYDKFPKQRDKDYKYPYMAVGAKVKVCFHYDTSKYCMGTLVRSDLEEPFEEIIRLDDGRFIRAVECQYSFVDVEEKESEDKPMLHKVTVTKTEEKVLEEYYVMRGIRIIPCTNAKEVIKEEESNAQPTLQDIAQFLTNSGADFVSVEHNYRFEPDLPFC